MTTIAEELLGEGYPVEFVILSDANADDFVERTEYPIFGDSASGRPAWQEMSPSAVKHDTFVYSRTGQRTLFWDRSEHNLQDWSADIRAAVEAEGL
jgi:hypothetical protein